MPLMRKIFYTAWYWCQPPWDTNITPPEVFAFLAGRPPGRALDLGCGTGTNAITLAQHGWQATGVDFVARAIRVARKKARQARVQVDLRVGDVTRLNGIAGPFDLILDIGCYHSLPPRGMETYRSQVIRLLETGGTFMLYAFLKEGETASGSGVVEANLEAFSPSLNPISRVEGSDRGARPSVWLTFRKDEG